MEWLENPDYAELGARLNHGTPTGYRQVVSKVTLRLEIVGTHNQKAVHPTVLRVVRSRSRGRRDIRAARLCRRALQFSE